MILTPLQKLPKNGGDWGKLIVAKGFKKLPKVQNIAQSGHTGSRVGQRILTYFVTGSITVQLTSYFNGLYNIYCLLCFVEFRTDILFWLNQNQSNRRPDVQ